MTKKLDDAVQSMIRNLEPNTGKSLDQWLALTKKTGFEKHGQVLGWLKKEHGVSHGYANLIAQMTLRPEDGKAGDEEELVTTQYSGAKAELRAIYDVIARKVSAFGKDVELAPKKTYVSLRRTKQFGLIQPSTSKRVDIGINLKDVPAKGRLEKSGSFNAMVTHRVRVEDVRDVDVELIGWLKQAYEQA